MADSGIRHVRLVNGEEIIAVVDGENVGDSWVFEEPYIIQEVVGEEGQEMMTLARYVPYSEEKVTIAKSMVVTITPVMDAFEKYYRISKEYNKHFLEKKAEGEISRITRMMENVLDQHRGTNVKKSNGEVIIVNPAFLQTSNSHH